MLFGGAGECGWLAVRLAVWLALFSCEKSKPYLTTYPCTCIS